MSSDQIDRSLAKLKKRSLIETSQHKFAGRMAYMHYRLLPRALVLTQPYAFTPSETDLPDVPQDTPGMGQNTQPLFNGDMVISKGYKEDKSSSSPLETASGFSGTGLSGKKGSTTMSTSKSSKTPKAPYQPPKSPGMSAKEMLALKGSTGTWAGKKATF